jgi:soluble lytic murein transglycosylase-like protein
VRAFVLALVLVPTLARADIWVREDPDGVLHFTNIGPKGGGWRKIYKTGPGKAQAVSGTVGGCRESRADVVPANDHSPERYSRYDRDIRDAASLYQLPEALIRAVIKIESDYDPRVVSCAGARGMMQIMPVVERDMGIDDVWNPRENIMGGTRLLRRLANRFHGDLSLTIAGYHAGAGAIDKYHGVPPYETTQLYLSLVTKQYYKFKARLGAVPPPPLEAAASPREGAAVR